MYHPNTSRRVSPVRTPAHIHAHVLSRTHDLSLLRCDRGTPPSPSPADGTVYGATGNAADAANASHDRLYSHDWRSLPPAPPPTPPPRPPLPSPSQCKSRLPSTKEKHFDCLHAEENSATASRPSANTFLQLARPLLPYLELVTSVSRLARSVVERREC